eukprot:2655918-Pleurochrysis_carterae.AAC.3
MYHYIRSNSVAGPDRSLQGPQKPSSCSVHVHCCLSPFTSNVAEQHAGSKCEVLCCSWGGEFDHSV